MSKGQDNRFQRFWQDRFTAEAEARDNEPANISRRDLATLNLLLDRSEEKAQARLDRIKALEQQLERARRCLRSLTATLTMERTERINQQEEARRSHLFMCSLLESARKVGGEAAQALAESQQVIRFAMPPEEFHRIREVLT